MTATVSNFIRAGSVLSFVLCAAASAQTVFPEVEPNSTVGEATVVNCMNPGDSLTGTTTGTTYQAANGALTTIDFFKMNTCGPLPLAIYRQKLTLASAILGQAAGSEVTNQTNATGCGAASAVGGGQYGLNLLSSNEIRWDAFGKQELQYVQIRGTPGTTAPYTLTLATPTVITPTVIGPFQGGSITITTSGPTSPANAATLDTSFVVYDSNLSVVPTFHNEDECPPLSATDYLSTMTRTFAPGTYYLAMGTYPLIQAELDFTDDNGSFNGQYLAQFPDLLIEAGTAGTINFAVTDSSGTTQVSATKLFFYDTNWFKFTVNTPSPGVTMCVPGVSGVIACACGNPNGAGAGCANTGSSGGIISSAGTASLASDATDPGTVTLTGTSMLSGSSCIFLQGDNTAGAGAGVTFGAGIRCTGGQLFRLKVKGISGGSATYPIAGDQSISNRSSALGTPIPAAATRWYQIYYRDPTLANPGGSCPPNATFNITNGQSMVWN